MAPNLQYSSGMNTTTNRAARKYSSIAGMTRTEMKATLAWAFQSHVSATIKGDSKLAADCLQMAEEIADELKSM